LKNVVVAPHLASLILETLQGNFEDAVRNVKKVRRAYRRRVRVA